MSALRKFYDDQVNAQWPATIPALTATEAERAARRLYRVAMGRACTLPVKVTAGRNHTYIRRGTLRVNPAKGWRDLVHGLGHAFYALLYPNRKPHSGQHASMERALIRYVVGHGWLEGKLKPATEESAPADKRAANLARTLAAIKRWETKEKRARNALKKLRAKAKRQERDMTKPRAEPKPRAKPLTMREKCERLAATLGLTVAHEGPHEFVMNCDNEDLEEAIANAHRMSGYSWSDLYAGLQEIEAAGTVAEFTGGAK